MLRNRFIFSLIYSNGSFMQSRNFRLQRVGDINWLETNYNFQAISFSLDELVVLDTSRAGKDIEDFSSMVKRLVGDVFMPVAAGGGIRKLEDADRLFSSGADKVVLNTALYEAPELSTSIMDKYGAQSLVASVDYKLVGDVRTVFIRDGSFPIPLELGAYLQYLEDLGVGEILLNSIDKDGTGFGYDLDTMREYGELLSMPLIIMGGAGNETHLHKGLSLDCVSAVATANLFNFIGEGLPNARQYMLENGANLARWQSAD